MFNFPLFNTISGNFIYSRESPDYKLKSGKAN